MAAMLQRRAKIILCFSVFLLYFLVLTGMNCILRAVFLFRLLLLFPAFCLGMFFVLFDRKPRILSLLFVKSVLFLNLNISCEGRAAVVTPRRLREIFIGACVATHLTV